MRAMPRPATGAASEERPLLAEFCALLFPVGAVAAASTCWSLVLTGSLLTSYSFLMLASSRAYFSGSLFAASFFSVSLYCYCSSCCSSSTSLVTIDVFASLAYYNSMLSVLLLSWSITVLAFISIFSWQVSSIASSGTEMASFLMSWASVSWLSSCAIYWDGMLLRWARSSSWVLWSASASWTGKRAIIIG